MCEYRIGVEEVLPAFVQRQEYCSLPVSTKFVQWTGLMRTYWTILEYEPTVCTIQVPVWCTVTVQVP